MGRAGSAVPLLSARLSAELAPVLQPTEDQTNPLKRTHTAHTCCRSLLAPVVTSGSPNTISSAARPPRAPTMRAKIWDLLIRVGSSPAAAREEEAAGGRQGEVKGAEKMGCARAWNNAAGGPAARASIKQTCFKSLPTPCPAALRRTSAILAGTVQLAPQCCEGHALSSPPCLHQPPTHRE